MITLLLNLRNPVISILLFVTLSVLAVVITQAYILGLYKDTSLNSLYDVEMMDDIADIEIDINKPYMWVYWELVNGAVKPPEYITLCLDIIKKNGSKCFNVIQLNERNIFTYIPDLRKDINDLPIALKTDYIRIKLLYLYGGLWIDADTILMNNLKDIAYKLIKGVDFIGFGCTGTVCKDQEGYGRPSNGVMGSTTRGKLIGRCLKTLDSKLNEYYAVPGDKRNEFDYFELGKMIIWNEYDKLIKDDPNYIMYHVPSYSDGTRDKNGNWIATQLIFEHEFKYSQPDKLLVVMLANSSYCGKDPRYNWFCKLTCEQILSGKYFISSLFRKAIEYNT
jgi:hypothetical protein